MPEGEPRKDTLERPVPGPISPAAENFARELDTIFGPDPSAKGREASAEAAERLTNGSPDNAMDTLERLRSRLPGTNLSPEELAGRVNAALGLQDPEDNKKVVALTDEKGETKFGLVSQERRTGEQIDSVELEPDGGPFGDRPPKGLKDLSPEQKKELMEAAIKFGNSLYTVLRQGTGIIRNSDPDKSPIGTAQDGNSPYNFARLDTQFRGLVKQMTDLGLSQRSVLAVMKYATAQDRDSVTVTRSPYGFLRLEYRPFK